MNKFKLLRTLRLLRAYVSLVRDPSQLDLVFELADASLGADEEAAVLALLPALVRERLEVVEPAPALDLKALRVLPEGTFGRAIAEFFDRQGFDPAGLYHSKDPSGGGPVDRFRYHMERTHDLWHVVTGFGTDVAGELGLQAFTLAQVEQPLAYFLLSGGLLNALLYHQEDGARRMDAITRGWRMGREAGALFGAEWAAMFTWPLEQVRQRLGIPSGGVAVAEPARAAA